MSTTSTTLFGRVIDDNDQTRARDEHLKKIQALVGNAYPNKFSRTNVTKSPEGEDTTTSLVNDKTLKRIVGDERFAEAFTLLKSKVKAGERPTPEDLEPVNAKLNDIRVRVSGRLATPPRVMGKVAFVHLSDGKERLQIYVRKQEAQAISNDSGQPVEETESGWQLFQLLDHGDFIGVEGKLFVTKTGEMSVHVETLQFLSKALQPMPDKLHGINDPEIRQRQRYADLIASSLKVRTEEEEKADGETGDDEPSEAKERELSTREVFERRSKLITAMRRHLDEHGYLEVETPMLSPIASGAAAKPFETFHKALGIPLYLRIAPELYLKRLLVGGFERVYELNRNFRNEGISTRHNPEFTMLEFYTAYKDVNWMMDFCEEMLRQTIVATVGGTTATFGETQIDFGRKFERLTMKEAIAKFWRPHDAVLGDKDFNIDWLDDEIHIRRLTAYLLLGDAELLLSDAPPERVLNDSEFANKLRTTNKESVWKQVVEMIAVPSNADEQLVNNALGKNIQTIFEEVAEDQLTQPTFITDFPKPISPLSKASPDNPAIAERFELYVAGMEVANGFSELNDPAEQLARFEDQAKQREGGDEEAMQTDLDYVRALSYGMPPAAGIGIGIDRMTMLLTNRRSIR
ncbi:MAG: lysyl-tRNA synthetase, class, partial [Acidobacteriota bacterium]|nr:lysyl-tRNA synthetase, class [Acidobacteriota bacterium]